MSATAKFPDPTVVWHGPQDQPLVVLLHGRGADAGDIIGLAERLPADLSYAAVRAPIAEGGGYAWFANRGIGRPIAESLRDTMRWFRDWLDEVADGTRPVFLVGFSGGAAFAGGLMLDEPDRYAGVAVLNGTIPFDAGVQTTPDHLVGARVFLAHGADDTVIPADLQARTWEYLTEGSGATTVARRDRSGHVIHPPAVDALRDWLDARHEELR